MIKLRQHSHNEIVKLIVRKLKTKSNVTNIKVEPQIRDNGVIMVPDITYQKPNRGKTGVYPLTIVMDPTIKSTNK